jgi:hypothetical protein
MNSFARPTHEYQPTIIESGLLISRLLVQLKFLKTELTRGWVDFKTDPAAFNKRLTQKLFATVKKLASTPNALYAGATALMTTKNGRPVSVHMQLEYNFNLY